MKETVLKPGQLWKDIKSGHVFKITRALFGRTISYTCVQPPTNAQLVSNRAEFLQGKIQLPD